MNKLAKAFRHGFQKEAGKNIGRGVELIGDVVRKHALPENKIQIMKSHPDLYPEIFDVSHSGKYFDMEYLPRKATSRRHHKMIRDKALATVPDEIMQKVPENHKKLWRTMQRSDGGDISLGKMHLPTGKYLNFDVKPEHIRLTQSGEPKLIDPNFQTIENTYSDTIDF